MELKSRSLLDTPLSRSVTVFCAERIENPSRRSGMTGGRRHSLPTLEITDILPAKSGRVQSGEKRSGQGTMQ
jgi:hypothetical protein